MIVFLLWKWKLHFPFITSASISIVVRYPNINVITVRINSISFIILNVYTAPCLKLVSSGATCAVGSLLSLFLRSFSVLLILLLFCLSEPNEEQHYIRTHSRLGDNFIFERPQVLMNPSSCILVLKIAPSKRLSDAVLNQKLQHMDCFYLCAFVLPKRLLFAPHGAVEI